MASFRDPYHLRAGKLNFYCPLCEYHQTTNTILKINWRHHMQIAIATAAITIFCWPLFGLKAISFYLLIWGGFEFSYRFRKRLALVCRSCGFDPFLYSQDVEKARAALRSHWQNRIETENLFAGKKLKNYRTNSLNKDSSSGAELPPSALTSEKEKTLNSFPPSS